MSKQFEVEAEFFTTTGKPVYVFITYLVKSTGYIFESSISTWKNKDYSEFHSLICFDTENSQYLPTEADAELWNSAINELIQNHYIKKVA